MEAQWIWMMKNMEAPGHERQAWERDPLFLSRQPKPRSPEKQGLEWGPSSPAPASLTFAPQGNTSRKGGRHCNTEGKEASLRPNGAHSAGKGALLLSPPSWVFL